MAGHVVNEKDRARVWCSKCDDPAVWCEYSLAGGHPFFYFCDEHAPEERVLDPQTELREAS